MSSIEIFNPREKPYGQLSNNVKNNMIINKELWTSVTQFIYSNMLNNYVYRDNIKKSNIRNIYNEYIKYRKKSEEDIISSSLEEAIKVKFETPDLLKILLSTGDSDILYVSPNSFLGIGYDQKGSNIFGKYLVQFRNHIINTKIKTEKLHEEENELYEAYIMYTLLKKEMVENGNNLSDYLYLKSGPEKIFDIHIVSNLNDVKNIYLKNNPDYKGVYERLLLDKYNKNLFLNLYERKDPELYPLLKYSLRNPSAIILFLRKMYLQSVRTNQEIIKYNNVFNMYLEYNLEIKYPEIKKEDYDTIINNEFKKQQFVNDPQYIIELNIINEKKNELEIKKIKLKKLYEEEDKIKNINKIKTLENTLIQYKNELKSIDRDNIPAITIKKQNIKDIETDIENLKNSLSSKDIEYEENKTKKANEDKKVISKYAELISEKNTKIQKYKKELDNFKKIYDDEIKENNILQNKKRELKNSLIKIRILKDDNEDKKAIKEKQKKDIENAIKDIDNEIENFKNKTLSSSTIENRKKIKDIFNKKSNIKILKTDTLEEKADKQNQINELKKQIDDLMKDNLSISHKKVKELEDEIKLEEEEINKLQVNINSIKKKINLDLELIFNTTKLEKDIKEDEKNIEQLENKLGIYKTVILNVNYTELKKRLFLVRNKLPPVLLEKINKFLSNLKIPTEEEVSFSKTFNLERYNLNIDTSSYTENNIVIPKRQIKIYQGNPSKDYISDLELIKKNSYQLLSPVYYTGMLRIKNFDYPTVTHYIIANLFANMPIIKKDVDIRLAELERLGLKIAEDTDNLKYIKENEKEYDEKIKYLENLNNIYKNKKQNLNKIYEKNTKNVLTFGGNLKEAQQYILKDPSGQNWNRNTPTNWIEYKTLYDKYFNISIIKEDERLKELAIIGINKKFEDRILQNLLISTENKSIIYTDRKDSILGIGKNNNGENFVGNYIMALRTEIFNQHNLENIEILTEQNVTNIIKGDIFMNNWLEMKVKDMCNVVKKVREYFKIKYNINIENNLLFFTIVLNKIFQPCSEIFELSNKVTAEAPLYFIKIVNKYIKNKYTPSIIELLWKRIVVMVYYIIKNVNDPTLYNIKNILLKVEMLVSKEQNCVSIIQDNEELNCIFSAIINILSGIIEYNNEYNKFKNNLVISTYAFYDENTGKDIQEEAKSVNNLINKYDIELALSIILNSKNIIHLEQTKNLDIELEEEELEEDKKEDNIQYFETEKLEGEEEDEDDKLEDEFSERESSSEDEYDNNEENSDKEDYGGEYDGAGNNLEQEQIYDYYNILLIKYIETNNIFDKRNDISMISNYIIIASKLILKYKRISEKIKRNRINFFATIG